MSVTLMFQRPPFLPQTRTVWTPNNNFLVLDQVTMSREESQAPKCDIRSVVSPYPLVLPYPLPRYTASCEEKGPAVPELQVGKLLHSSALWECVCLTGTVRQRFNTSSTKQTSRFKPTGWDERSRFHVMLKVYLAAPLSRNSICSSSMTTISPGSTRFCKFGFIPAWNIQIRDESKCKFWVWAMYLTTRKAN